jgi:membrane protein implicated in regulation of membrane protease activity
MHDEVYCLFIMVLGMLALLVPASTQVLFVGFAVVLALVAGVSRQVHPPRRSADPDRHRIGEG